MGDRHDYVALEWVKGEIGETLKLAQNALETYVEHPDAIASMQDCAQYIHQVHGSLKMVEFFGAALLAEEMERLAQALAEQTVSNKGEALEVMMQAMLQLPMYLEQVQTARHDLPLVVLPLLNDLRAARDEKLLSETSLFSPANLVIPPVLSDAELRKLEVNDLETLLRKMRQILQMALVGVLREQDLERNLAYLKRVFTHLENLAKKAPIGLLWQFATALVDGLSSDKVLFSASVRRLLRELDSQLRTISEQGLAGFNQQPSEELLKNLLFYIAKARGASELADRIIDQYELEQAFPEASALTTSDDAPIADRSAIRSVVVALSEELMRIKDALDLFVRGDRKQYEDLAKLQAPMKQVADTLAVIGMSNLRRTMLSQIDLLAHYEATQESISDNTLMDIAGAILFIEVSLNNMIDHDEQARNEQSLLPTTDVQKIHHLVIREAHTGLAQVKDHIIGFITSQWDHVHLASIPALLTQVRGALTMIPLPEAAKIIEDCNSYIEHKLISSQAVPSWHTLDTLADIITGVEYYLECLSEDPAATTDEALNIARQGLESLGYFAEKAKPVALPEAQELIEAPVEAAEEIIFDNLPVLDDSLEHQAEVLDAELPDTEPVVEDALPAVNLFDEEPASTSNEELVFDSAALPEFALDAEQQDHTPELSDDGRLAIFSDDAFALDDLNETVASDALSVEESPALELDDLALEHTPADNLDLAPEETLAEEVVGEEDTSENASAQTMTIAEVMAAPVQEINPQAKNVPETLLPPPADEEPVDEELREIFVEEAGEVQETLTEFYPEWKYDTDDNSALTEVRRAFHTLKGSGRMVRALVIGELAWSIENMLNRVIDRTIKVSPELFQVIDNVIEILPSLIKEYEDQAQCQRDDVDLYASIAHALSRNESVAHLVTQPAAEETVESIELDAAGLPESTDDADIPTLEDIDLTSAETPAADDAQRLAKEAELDPVLLEIFAQETESHLEALQHFLNKCAVHLPQVFPEDIQRALHTLKGSAKMAEITPIADIVTPLEKLAKEYKASLWQVTKTEYELFRDSYALLVKGLRQLSTTPLRPIEGAPALIERIEQVNRQFEQHLVEHTQEQLDLAHEDHDAPSQRDLAACSDLLFSTEDQLEQWRQFPAQRPDLAQLIADLQQLASYASDAQLPQIAQFANVLGDLYQNVEDGQLAADQSFFEHAHNAHESLINMMDQFMAGLDVAENPAEIAALKDYIELHKGTATETQTQPQVTLEQAEIAPATEPLASTANTEFAVDYSDSMVDVFIEEATDVIESANKRLESWLANPEDSEQLTALMRDLHTLKGSSRMAGVEPIGSLAHAIETLYEGLISGKYHYLPTLAELLHKGHDDLAQMVELLNARQPLFVANDSVNALAHFCATNEVSPDQLTPAVPEVAEVVETAEADIPVVNDLVLEPELVPEPATATEPAAETASQVNPTYPVDYSDEMIDIFMEEARDVSESANNRLEEWLGNTQNVALLTPLMRDLHTLKGGARMSGVDPLGNLAHETESIYEGLISGKYAFEPALADLLHRAHDDIAQLIELLAARQPLFVPESTFRSFRIFRETGQVELPSTSAAAPAIVEAPTVAPTQSMRDPELVEIFLEEAFDLLDNATHSLQGFIADPNNLATLASMQRDMHTLKGGARMAEIPEIGNLAHELEFIYEDLSSERLKGSQTLYELMQETHDMLGTLLDQVKADKALTDTSDLLLRIKRVRDPNAKLEDLPQVAGAAHVDPATALATARVQAAQVKKDTEFKAQALPFLAKAQESKEQAAHQEQDEQVRVSAGLLEELVNLAGETSIFRGRIEQQISRFLFTLNDMQATIDRVRDQLRRMDMETQAQIISRHHDDIALAEGDEDFDPLEMDQYSQLQQLSRSLFESASDLSDLKETLATNVRDTETLLLQQARINTELQEGLMRTRMVPFDRLLPRLRRIVRQISGELDKKVNFEVHDGQGEMDRTVMERMVAPLEHLLRNAIDHGVETPEKRQSDGKTAIGNVNLTISREGGDIVMVLADDGAGVNIDAVRKKAIERGFIKADQKLSDHDVVQLILRSGLSTAKQLTQISGRGVGMDVVNSQIKQLGGSVSIESKRGQGTRFIIRLPFTVSVDRALMVIAGEDLYAIPLNSIDGIVRVAPRELEALYKQAAETGQAHFEYAGHSYALRYIGELLQNGQQPKLEGQVLPLPVILVRGNEYSVAVQVDILSGSREIVVKSLGAQFAGVRGLSGATILGDGRVVVILDLLAMIRSRQVQQINLDDLPAQEEKEERPTLVMVVDDSVTVRKVTTRLLERNHMQVVTAKDGADAIAQLQEVTPDVMLLDIEMPRMDGFEVARLVRHNPRIKELPIIMITSRTGDKHRERAFSLGVNEYLGKPFQEDQLLETIHALLEHK